MKFRVLAAGIAGLLLVVLGGSPVTAQAADDGTQPTESVWYPESDAAAPSVALYFVYSETCPHCAAAQPFVDYLDDTYDWLMIERVSTQSATDSQVERVVGLANELNEEITGVPAFLFCERMEVGFGSIATTGATLEDEILSCRASLVASLGDAGSPSVPTTTEEQLSLPVLGDVDAASVSLPLFTVAVAGLDAFNPCAFFVLLFLLSLLVHAKSRWRMALVGGVFVVISGVMYFAFMAAWLNVFLVTGQLRWVTAVAGVVALGLAAMNLKEYFWPETAGSLSIPETAKPGLFGRMRHLTTEQALPAVLLGTVTLAAAANAYELLCTAGFPLVFTRVLTLNELSTPTYYAYLGLYNVVYIVPLLLIVGVFVWTLGSRKLSETEGRFLKLMSGTMMAGLGLLLLLKPELLENMLAAVTIMALALVAAVAITMLRRHHQPEQKPRVKVS